MGWKLTVITLKTNTYPKLVNCLHIISLNNEVIKNLKPEIEVSPDVV